MPTIKLDIRNTKFRDTYVRSDTPDKNYSTDTLIPIGVNAGITYRTLLKFDLGLIPNNAIINSATLTLVTANSLPALVKQHLITSNYDETAVTWNNQPTRDSVIYPAVTTPSTVNTAVNLDVKEVLQKIVNGNGYGILLENDSSDYDSFSSSRQTTDGYRPTLTVDYTISTTDKKQVEFIDKVTSYNTSANTASINLAVPSNKKAGDMLVAFIGTYNGTGNMVAPSGWSTLSINEISAGVHYMSVFYKISDGTETILSTTTGSVCNYNGSVHVYRNVKAIYNHGVPRYQSSTVHFPNPPTDLLPNRLLITFISSPATVSGTPPINFYEESDNNSGGIVANMISHSYNYSKTSYSTTELSTTITATAGAGSKAISLEPITNEVPKIDGQDEFLGSLSSPLIKPYTVTDTENDKITITEKIDGNVIRSYQGSGAQTLNLTSQWASLPLGKHTVTIEANDDYANPPHTPTVRTWTFLKILPDTATLTESVTGLHQVVPFLQSQKAILASALRGRGITVTDTDRLEDMAKALNNAGGKVLSGVATSSSATVAGELLGGTGTANFYTVSTNALTFKPKRILIKPQSSNGALYLTEYIAGFMASYQAEQVFLMQYTPTYTASANSYGFKADKNGLIVNDTSFVLPVGNPNAVYEWFAYEN